MADSQCNDYADNPVNMDNLRMIYEYHCDKCGDFEVHQSIHDDSLSTCPTCNGNVEKIISCGLYYFDATPKTLGSVADRNTSKNKMEISELEHGRKPAIDKDLMKMTETEKANFIMTGKKPIGISNRGKRDRRKK